MLSELKHFFFFEGGGGVETTTKQTQYKCKMFPYLHVWCTHDLDQEVLCLNPA